MLRTTVARLDTFQKKVLMLAADGILVPLSVWTALGLRGSTEGIDLGEVWAAALALTLVTIVIFVRLGLYRAVLRFVGRRAVEQIAFGVMLSAMALGFILMLMPDTGLRPFPMALRYGFVAFAFVGGSRFVARMLITDGNHSSGAPVAIYGAGCSGRQLLALLRNGPAYDPVLFLDDNRALHGREIDGLAVLDPRAADLEEMLRQRKVKEILLCMPSVCYTQRRHILQLLEPLPQVVKTVPAMEQILAGKAKLDQVEAVAVEDLLGRDPVPPNVALLDRCIKGKTVLVTGAGGSIGSELCRQVTALGARCLLMLDVSELALYQIDHELRVRGRDAEHGVEVIPLLGSVADEARMAAIFASYRIDTVYHAAAYKHVPMVEHNPVQGIGNNTVGTWVAASLAASAGVRNFVLISTDKAVRPTNVMGASKRLAEMVLQAMQKQFPDVVFCMVRFGNVLGSSGSVVPLFKKQIAKGGPVTVTHPEITRFFMTIPEAVQLVIQAGAMAGGGDVFVLDMGEPVKIVDLARKMIHLTGLSVRDAANPQGDIAIAFSGLRPGEKLYEELLIGDNVTGTDHPKIMRAHEEMLPWSELQPALEELQLAMYSRDLFRLRQLLVELVSGYRPHETIEDWLWQRQEQGLQARREAAEAVV